MITCNFTFCLFLVNRVFTLRIPNNFSITDVVGWLSTLHELFTKPAYVVPHWSTNCAQYSESNEDNTKYPDMMKM